MLGLPDGLSLMHMLLLAPGGRAVGPQLGRLWRRTGRHMGQWCLMVAPGGWLPALGGLRAPPALLKEGPTRVTSLIGI